MKIETGKKFGRLTFVELTKRDSKRSGNRYAKFKCECGKETNTRLSKVIRGETKSCGCLRKEYYNRICF